MMKLDLKKLNINKLSKQKILLITLAIIIVLYIALTRLGGDKKVDVSSIKIANTNITKTINLSGMVYSKDMDEIAVTPNVKVMKVYVKENEYVETGKLLAELDTSDLEINLEKSKISLEQLSSDLLVKKNIKNNTDITLLKNNLERSEEQYLNLKKDLDKAIENKIKAEELFKENAISQAELDNQITAVKNYESNLKISQLNLNDAKLKYNDYNQNISQEINTLERKIQTTSLDIENLQNQIEKNKIYATISGIVTEFPLYEGRKTLNTDKVMIHNTNAFEFVSNVAQDDAVLLREGQKAKVWLDGINKEYAAEVTQISKAAQQDEQSGSKTPKVEVKISLTNPDNFIISGFNAESNVTIDSLENVLAVRNECIKKDKENKTFVYLIENNTAIIKYVESGLSDGYKTQIKSGLNENDKVVINPPIELTDGSKVNVVKEDTNGL